MGVPKSTLRFDDLLGFTELSKALLLRVVVYNRERIHIKMSKGKIHVGQRLGETRPELLVVPSRWSSVDSACFSYHPCCDYMH